MESLCFWSRFAVGILAVAFINAAPLFSYAQDTVSIDKPAELFFFRCAGCHTVGGGDLSGPDLKSSTQWGDGDLRNAVKRMEANAGVLTDEEVNQLVEFLKDLSVGERIESQKKSMEAKLRADLPEPSFEKGQQLFRGSKMFANGGPSCIVCHRFVNEGGSLGPDLSRLSEKSSGVVLQSSIEKSSFNVMRPIYDKHKITPEEAAHLSEYLSHPEKVAKRLVPTQGIVVLLSTVGFGAFFVLIWIMNKKRKGPTREKLVRKYKSQ